MKMNYVHKIVEIIRNIVVFITDQLTRNRKAVKNESDAKTERFFPYQFIDYLLTRLHRTLDEPRVSPSAMFY